MPDGSARPRTATDSRDSDGPNGPCPGASARGRRTRAGRRRNPEGRNPAPVARPESHPGSPPSRRSTGGGGRRNPRHPGRNGEVAAFQGSDGARKGTSRGGAAMNGRSNRPTERLWDEQRLADAYRALAARPAPADLADATLAASADRAKRSVRGIRGSTRPMLRWPRAALGQRNIGRVLVAVFVAGLALRSTPAPVASAAPEGVPQTVDG